MSAEAEAHAIAGAQAILDLSALLKSTVDGFMTSLGPAVHPEVIVGEGIVRLIREIEKTDPAIRPVMIERLLMEA